MIRYTLIAATLLVSLPIQATEPIQISPNTYLISEVSHAGIFASLPKLKIKVLRKANEFAASKGLIAIPVSLRITPAGGPAQWPEAEYQFRLVEKGDPEAAHAILVPRADTVIAMHQTIETKRQDSAAMPDLYAELTKLDDLRKRGLLTDAEFDTQKKKLLEKQPK